MDDSYVLKDLEQIKALADPLRLKIYKALCGPPRTTKQVAEELGESPTKLYRHVNLLAKLKLIKLIKTQRNRGTVEKYYQAVAQDLEIDRKVFSTLPREKAIAAFYEVVNGIFQTTLSEIRHTLEAKRFEPQTAQQAITLIREEVRANPAQIEQIKPQLQEWVNAFAAHNDPEGQAQYKLTLLLYPTSVSEHEKTQGERS